VFHFNKQHLKDDTIPMWVLKFRGETFYVNHVTCSVPWTTKETPDNAHTKGAIKVKNCLVKIDNDNCAEITTASDADFERLKSQIKSTTLITSYGSRLRTALDQMKVKHNPIKSIGGGCGTHWYVCEIFSNKVLLALQVALGDTDLRELKANEDYYKMYHKHKHSSDEWIDEDDYYEELDEQEEKETLTSKISNTFKKIVDWSDAYES